MSLNARLKRNLYLKAYLEELGELLGRKVNSEELGDLEEVEKLAMASQHLQLAPMNSFECVFSSKGSESFQEYLIELEERNSSPIYVWTPKSKFCGVLRVGGLSRINFDFEYSRFEEGIISFLTCDLRNQLLLDFFETESAQRMIEIEVQGAEWAAVRWNG